MESAHKMLATRRDKLTGNSSQTARELEDLLVYLWGRPSASTVVLDNFIRKIPFIGENVRPLFLERVSRRIRSVAALLHLRTLRFAVVNRLQPFTTLWGVADTPLMVEAKKLQHSPEGKRILDQYNVRFDVGQYQEPGTMTRLKDISGRFFGERSNQEWAFLALYLKGTKAGMSPDAAAGTNCSSRRAVRWKRRKCRSSWPDRQRGSNTPTRCRTSRTP